MNQPHWLEALTGRSFPKPPPGPFGAPSNVDDVFKIHVHTGWVVHAHEVQPGLYLLATTPKNVQISGADLWTGIATGAATIVTKLGDWVASWFPKAQEARARGAVAADRVAMDLEADAAERQNELILQSLKIERVKARMLEQKRGAEDIDSAILALKTSTARLPVTAAEIRDRVEASQAAAAQSLVDAAAAGAGIADLINNQAVAGRARARRAGPGVVRMDDDEHRCNCGGTCGKC